MRQWEPAELQSIEYDENGRVVQVVTVRESEFSADDVAVMLQSRRLERAPRNHLGILLSDATDPASSWNVGVETRTENGVIQGPVTDLSVAALKSVKDSYYRAYPDEKDNPALMWPVRRS